MAWRGVAWRFDANKKKNIQTIDKRFICCSWYSTPCTAVLYSTVQRTIIYQCKVALFAYKIYIMKMRYTHTRTLCLKLMSTIIKKNLFKKAITVFKRRNLHFSKIKKNETFNNIGHFEYVISFYFFLAKLRCNDA